MQPKEYIDDTDVHILMSIDSVTEIRAVKTKKDRDMWMQIKSGSWVIKKYDTVKNDYWLTLHFNDGHSKDLHFIPGYETFPAPSWMKPISYEIQMGDAILQKVRDI